MDDDTRSDKSADDSADDSGPPTQHMSAEDFEDETRTLDTPAEDTQAGQPTQRVSGGPDDFPTRRFDPATPVASAEYTEVIDIPADPRAGRATGIAVAMAILAFLAAVLVGYVTRVPHPPGLVGRQLVGPDGGTVTFDGSGRVEIPRGALSTATTITIRRVALNQDVKLTRPNGAAVEFKPGSATLYAFEPKGTTFNQPITIRFPANGTADAALVVTSDQVRVIAGEQQGKTFVIKTQDFAFR